MFQPNAHPLRSMLHEFIIPWKLFAFPIVVFASFAVSWSASCFLTLNLTQSQEFAAPPYDFSSQTVEFFNIATFVGASIGLATNGPLSDWVSDRATRKNGGIREPEMRLVAMIPYFIVMLIGNFVVAFGYQYKWNWKVHVHPRWSHADQQTDSELDHRAHWLHLRRNSSSSAAIDFCDVCSGQLQAGRRSHLCYDHSKQEPVGIRIWQFHHTLDRCQWCGTANHDEHELDCAVLSC